MCGIIEYVLLSKIKFSFGPTLIKTFGRASIHRVLSLVLIFVLYIRKRYLSSL